MLYNEYKEKLNRRKRIFERVWRFRLLILLGFLLILAAAGALMGVKGIVYGEKVPQSVVYGDEFSATVKAVLAKGGFEFREEGGEWTEQRPLYAGEYECRGFAKTIAGTKRYTAAHAFTVLPLESEINFSGDTLIYGDDPEFSADLKYGDKLQIDYRISKDGDKVTLSADACDVCVLNSAGEDVTSSYIFGDFEKTVREERRPVTVKTASAVFVYDGKEHCDKGYEITSLRGLAKGDSLSFSTPYITDKSALKNTISDVKIENADGEDVTDRYNLTCEAGLIEVTARAITVTTNSHEIYYDGKAHEFGLEATISKGAICDGQTFEVSYNGVTEKDAGNYVNSASINIFADGKDVTDNYGITYDFGKITINPLEIKVKTQADDFVYDGRAHTYGKEALSLADGKLADGEELTVALNGESSFTEAGTGLNDITADVISASGEREGKNYVISYEYGEINVRRRGMKVSSVSEKQTEYNGSAQSFEYADYECTPADGDGGLVSGHRLEITAYRTFTDVGENYPQNPDYKIVDGSRKDVTANYEIDEDFGYLTIIKREITVNIVPKTFEYNGEAQSSDEIEVVGLVGGHVFSHTLTSVLTSVTDVSDGVKQNSFEFELTVTDSRGNDVTTNYDIREITSGSIQIAKRSVILSTDSLDVTYDGNPHSKNTYSEVENTLVAGHKLQADYSEWTAAGNYANAAQNCKITDINGNDVSGNYDFTVQSGTIRILKRNLTLKTGSVSVIYNATEQSCQTCEYLGDGLADGQSLTAEYDGWYNCGVHVNALKAGYSVTDGKDDTTDNYNITEQWGSVIIVKRPVTITTGSLTQTYDDKPHSAANFTASTGEDSGLAAGHKLTLVYPEFTEVNFVGGSVAPYTNEPVSFELTDGSNNDSFDGFKYTDNYDISWVYGEVEIMLRPIKITSPTARWTYDGLSHTGMKTQSDGVTYIADGGVEYPDGYPQLDGHTVTPADFPEITEKGVYAQGNSFDVAIFKGVIDVTANYDITTDFGDITVEARPLKLSTRDYSKTYDAISLLRVADTIDVIEIASGCSLADGQRINTYFYRDIYDVGEYENKPTTFSILDADGVDRQTNYDIFWGENGNDYGTITIEKRPIRVITKDRVWVAQKGVEITFDGFIDPKDEIVNGVQYYSLAKQLGIDLFSHRLKLQGITVDLSKTTDTADGKGYIDNIPQSASIVFTSGEREADVTGNYDIHYVYGKLRVKAPVEVFVFPVSREYDGTALTFGEDDYYISSLPFGLSERNVSFKVIGSITEPGIVTKDEVYKDSKKWFSINGWVPLEEGGIEDEDRVNRIDFTGGFEEDGQTYYLRITKRKITIRSNSIIMSPEYYEDEHGQKTQKPFNASADSYTVSFGELLEGHILNATVTGVLLPEEERATNTLLMENVHIYDSFGADVTEYYEITIAEGELSWSAA